VAEQGTPTEAPPPADGGAAIVATERHGAWGTLRGALAPFENRDYRILWIGVSAHSFTLWMEIVARNWLVWELTGSPVALGLINFWRTIPVLFLAIPAGVVADRVNRKLILISTQLVILAAYGILLLLLLAGRLEIWHAYALFFMRGVAITFNQPPRQALIPSLVGQGQVPSAVALQQLGFNGTRVFAPILTGVLFIAGGASAAFAVIVAVEVLIIIAWLVMRVPPMRTTGPDGAPRESAIRSSVNGLQYAARNRVVLLLILFGLLSLLLLQPWSTLLPIILSEKFNVGADGYGTFVSLSGIGSVIGPLAIALLSGFRSKGAIVVAAMICSGVALMGLAAAPIMFLAMGIVVLLGAFDSMQRVLTNSLLLTQTDPAYHGRIVSLYLLDRGFVPIGSLAAGYMAESYSASVTLIALGAAMAVSVAVLAAFQPGFLKAR
jgi:MFS family permease